jgi:alkylated DNA repair dioxygenase AlkB
MQLNVPFYLDKSPKTWYVSEFLDEELANSCFSECNGLKGWKKNDVFGFPLSRETMVFVSDSIIEQVKSGDLKIPEIWGENVVIKSFPENLKIVKGLIEKRTNKVYNIALGNRYLRSKDKIAFHSDNEEFGDTQSIASISLGVSRTFTFIPKGANEDNVKNDEADVEERKTLKLNHGSLLFMGENCQENYLHGMKKESIEPHNLFDKTRINVTFRNWNY